MNRPCLGCGELVGSSSRCRACRLPTKPRNRPKGHPHTNTARWKRISAKARKAQPWCLDCGATGDLCGDHVIPVAERPDLAHDELNVTVRCRPCNGRRGANCTEKERQAVLAAIAERTKRRQRFYAAEARASSR